MIESHLAKYRSLMPSLAVLFHLLEVIDGKAAGPVGVDSAQLAIAWCDYLEAHARRVYACVSDPDLEPARVLSERIKGGELSSPFSYRDVYRRGWSSLDTPEAVRRAVALLEDRGWVHVVGDSLTGGAPREDVYLHPKLPTRPPKDPEMPTPEGPTKPTKATQRRSGSPSGGFVSASGLDIL
jgi:hypothetical protein